MKESSQEGARAHFPEQRLLIEPDVDLQEQYNKYILLDVLLCSIAEYFYELCHIQTTSKKFSAILHNKTSNKRFIIQHAKLLCPCGRIFIYGERVTEVCEAERNWRGKSS